MANRHARRQTTRHPTTTHRPHPATPKKHHTPPTRKPAEMTSQPHHHETPPQLASVVRALDADVMDRFAGGAFGAFHIRTASGAQAVLKLLPQWPELELTRVRSAAELVDRLVSRGYPAPRFLDVGTVDDTVYTVQEYVEERFPSRSRQRHPPCCSGSGAVMRDRCHSNPTPDGPRNSSPGPLAARSCAPKPMTGAFTRSRPRTRDSGRHRPRGFPDKRCGSR